VHEILKVPAKSKKEAQIRGEEPPDYLVPIKPTKEPLASPTAPSPVVARRGRWSTLRSKFHRQKPSTKEKAGAGQKKTEALPADIAKLPPEERISAALDLFKVKANDGLSSSEAGARLEKYGPNELPFKEKSKIIRYLLFFWNPLAWYVF